VGGRGREWGHESAKGGRGWGIDKGGMASDIWGGADLEDEGRTLGAGKVKSKRPPLGKGALVPSTVDLGKWRIGRH